MDPALTKLLEVQDKDNRIANLKKQVDSVPAEKARVEQEMDTADSIMAGAKATMQDVEKAIKTVEMEIGTLQQRKADLLGKSHQIKKNDEYKAMLHEVELFEKKIEALEDKQLENWEALEAAKSKRGDAQKEADAARARMQTHIEDLETRARNCQQQVEKVQKERDALAAEIDPEMLRLYERLLSKATAGEHFQPPLVPLDGEMCGSCRLQVVPQVRHKVMKNDMVTCENCGAILYNPDA